MTDSYKPRVVESLLDDKLDAMGAVLVEGPKYCGKTTMSTRYCNSVLNMAAPEERIQNIIMAETNPGLLLAVPVGCLRCRGNNSPGKAFI